jgi:hypothetical protein
MHDSSNPVFHNYSNQIATGKFFMISLIFIANVSLTTRFTVNGTAIVFGNITLFINNANVYSLTIVTMQLNGTIGKTEPNQVSFTQDISLLEIPPSGRSKHVLPINVVIPNTVNIAVLTQEIVVECAVNLNKLATVMSGTSVVRALGVSVPFQFGPQKFESRCI